MRLVAKRHRPILVMGDKVVTCCYGKIYLLDIDSGKPQYVCTLPEKKWKRHLSHFRIFERVLRIEPKAAIALNENHILVAFDGKILNINIKTGAVAKEAEFRNGMRGPSRMCRIEGIEGFDDSIAYGEYIINQHRSKPSGIFVRSLNSPEWKMAFEFPAGQVRHIHGVAPSEKTNCVYVLTGDLDNESGIWLAKDNFKTIEPLVAGAQMYRTIMTYEADKGLVYATDTALEQNYIYLLSHNQNEECNVKKIGEMDGSCVSSAQTERKILLSSTVEADESVQGLRSWINLKKGAGIKSDYAQLISVDKKTLETKKIVQFKKDALPYRLFQYGYMKIIDVPEKESILIYPIAVKKADGKLFELKYSELE